MAYENIKFRKANLVNVDGYFYMMDEDVDSLIVKTDDGTQAFSYPLSSTMSNSVTSMEHDGRNFWTLETSDTNEVTIKRWYINNYVCKLRNTFVMSPTGSHNYQSEAFTVEHYHRAFSGNESAGQSNLSINDTSRMESGHTLTLGPNTNGQVEEVTVDTVYAGSVDITGTTIYDYQTNDPITFYNHIWLFNDYDGLNATGALYEIDAYTGDYTTHSGGGEYYGIKACTFYDMSDVDASWANSICYVRATNTIFLDPTDFTNSFGSMVMDNVEDDDATNIVIYDLSIEGNNVYRLQRKATYYGTTTTFADNTYNYQLSTLESFITSISLQADPAILPANGVNQSDITAIVKDQFLQPIASRLVYFTDDDTVGAITTSPVNTNANGVATTKYTSGTTAREVKITATAQQS